MNADLILFHKAPVVLLVLQMRIAEDFFITVPHQSHELMDALIYCCLLVLTLNIFYS